MEAIFPTSIFVTENITDSLMTTTSQLNFHTLHFEDSDSNAILAIFLTPLKGINDTDQSLLELHSFEE